MGKVERAVPDVDPDGFVPPEAVLQRARALAPAEFLKVYSVPGLLVTGAPEDLAAQEGSRVEASIRRMADEDSALPDHVTVDLKYTNHIGFLTKRPGNLFPEMVSIGRALNCDIVLALSSVSKIHCLLHAEAGGKWTVSDQASRNGTLLNGKKLTPGNRVPLKDGDVLRIGLHLECVFLEPSSLRTRLLGR